MDREQELEQLIAKENRVIIESQAKVDGYREELAKMKSEEFIKANDIKTEDVHDTVCDMNFSHIHDNSKFDRAVREYIEKPWYVYNGLIYKTSVVKSGKSHYDSGTPARLKDLKELEKEHATT